MDFLISKQIWYWKRNLMRFLQSLVLTSWSISGVPYLVKISQNYENSFKVLWMSFWNDVQMQISIFVHEVDWKQNEVAPDWFKIKDFSAALSKKLNAKHWKTGEMFEISLKVSEFKVYLLLPYRILHFYLIVLPGKSLMMWSNIVTRNIRRYGASLLTFGKIGA